MKKNYPNINSLEEILPLINKLRKALKKSSGNEWHLIATQFKPTLEIFDSISVRDFYLMKYRAKKVLGPLVSPIFDLSFVTFVMMKKHIATARLFNFATTKAVDGIDMFVTKDYAYSEHHDRYLTYVHFVIKTAYTVFATLFFALINSPDSFFDLNNVFNHVKFFSSNVYTFVIKPIFNGYDDGLKFMFFEGYGIILSNAITFLLDVAVFSTFAALIYGFIILFYPVRLNNPLMKYLNKLKRTGDQTYVGLANSIPVSVVFFIRRFFIFYVNYDRVIESLFLEKTDKFEPRSKFFRTKRFFYFLLLIVYLIVF